jgi:hypothetical protein
VFNIFSASLAISLDNRDVAEITASILCQFSLKPIQAFKCSGVFTSGTTGEAKKNPKTWGQLNESAIRVGKRLWPKGVQGKCIIATVPPQHMFGFETSIIYPLTLGIMMHDGYPFYPLDIQQIVLETPVPIYHPCLFVLLR